MIKWIILATDNTERLSIYLLFIGALRIFIELLSFPSGCHHVKWEIIFVVIIHMSMYQDQKSQSALEKNNLLDYAFIFIKHEVVLIRYFMIAPSTLALYAELKFDDLRSEKAVFFATKEKFKKSIICNI